MDTIFFLSRFFLSLFLSSVFRFLRRVFSCSSIVIFVRCEPMPLTQWLLSMRECVCICTCTNILMFFSVSPFFAILFLGLHLFYHGANCHVIYIKFHRLNLNVECWMFVICCWYLLAVCTAVLRLSISLHAHSITFYLQNAHHVPRNSYQIFV